MEYCRALKREFYEGGVSGEKAVKNGLFKLRAGRRS
jgi:hypothetical protein